MVSFIYADHLLKLFFNPISHEDIVLYCYLGKHSPPLVSVGLSQLDAHMVVPHTCRPPHHPAIRRCEYEIAVKVHACCILRR